MSQSPPKSFVSPAHEIVTQIREQIRGGGYALGSAMPTERELATRFHTSRWMVRKALQTLEFEHLIVRQQGRGTFVVSSLDTGPPTNVKTGLIGLLVWEVEYGFARLVQGACAAAARRGYAVATSSVHNYTEEAQAVRAFIRNTTLGVLMSTRSPRARSYYQELLADNIAVVMVDTLIPNSAEDHVLIDNARGTQLATAHLIELGHQRIAFIAHDHIQILHSPVGETELPGDYPISQDRLRGFMETCQQHGLTVPPEYVVRTNEEHYRQPLLQLLEGPSRPTAIVAYNDMWAIRAIQMAHSLGLQVPRDLSVVGFDDSVFASGYDVPLTTINPERYDMGVSAVDLLIGKLEHPRSRPSHGLLVAPRLVIRNSTAPPPGS